MKFKMVSAKQMAGDELRVIPLKNIPHKIFAGSEPESHGMCLNNILMLQVFVVYKRITPKRGFPIYRFKIDAVIMKKLLLVGHC